mgnify:CR=1 FL=1
MKQLLLILVSLCSVSLPIHAQIPMDGLVAYYPFNGNANDESGNGDNGVITGAALTMDRNGSSSSAFSFNGNSKIVLSANGLMNRNFTYSVWAKFSTLPPNLAWPGNTYSLVGVGAYGADQALCVYL